MAKRLIIVCAWIGGVQLAVASVAFFGSRGTAIHGVLGMGIGLFVVWIILGGLLMRRYRDRIRRAVLNLRGNWQLKFILLATALAMLEEAVTVGMTNTAPLYRLTMTQAHITASANYWDVVLTNSVVLFVPMFCIWSWILSRYDLSPEAVFLLWGLTGTLMETIAGGPQHWLELGMWMFVYGLMIYLPAYSIPSDRVVKKPQWWQYPLFIALVLLGIIPGGALATLIRHIRVTHLFPA